MRKEYVISVAVVILIAAIGLLYYYSIGDDVKIVKLEAPQELIMGDSGELIVTLHNNEIGHVNVNIDVENAFIHKDGRSERYILGLENPENPDGTLTLLPGNNTYKFWVGYLVPGRHNVRVKVYKYGQLIDKDSVYVTVLIPQRPELTIQLSYRNETSNGDDIYNIYGYVTNDFGGDIYGYEFPVQITIINNKSGEFVSNFTDDYYINVGGTKTLSKWKGKPIAVIELAQNLPSNETYMPVESVAKGKIGDSYIVKVTATWDDPWYDQRYEMYGEPIGPQQIVVYDELVIPPE